MDSTFEAVSRLYSQGNSIRAIAKRIGISDQKVRKILITLGQYTNAKIQTVDDSLRAGLTITQIASNLGVAKNTVTSMLPYQKCIYNAEYPTINAIKIKKCRKQQDNELSKSNSTESLK